MKILVTGGAGFIGSHIVDLLIKHNHKVIVIDNLSTGNEKNINPKAKFYKKDICDDLTEIFKNEKFDIVIHQAAQANVRKSLENPVFDAQTNILGSLNLIQLSKKFKIKRFLFASSGGAIYGNPVYIPCDETHPINPISPYAIAKYSIEHYLKNSNLNYVILRYANVYGPRQDPLGEAGVVAIFTDKLLKKEQPTINGSGEQTRDFIYVEDVAQANLFALNETKNKIFNIGTSSETTVNKLFNQIKDLLNSKIQPKYGPEIPGEVFRSYLKCDLAKKDLKWQPKTNLNDGLKKTIEHFKNK